MPTTHHFTPTHYHNTLGAHQPALHIQPGDTVITTTVDTRGQDAAGAKITVGPNPQTGPFYIESAEPGDTLVVHLDRLTPNRDTGWSSRMLAENIIDPWYVPSLPFEVDREVAIWQVDTAAGTATLVEPEGRLGHFTLPIAPMVGCFGVAPYGNQAISAMTSAEAQFTVDVLKGKRSGWPRGENADYIFTLGNARPLDQAVQHATTEMLKWLQADYGLTMREANLLMGYCVQYDLGNMYAPAYTMVCKIPKRFLPA